MTTGTLFDIDLEKTPTAQTATVQCAGCDVTATVPRTSRRGSWSQPIPESWVLCGADAGGRLLAWCRQCVYEGRHVGRATA